VYLARPEHTSDVGEWRGEARKSKGVGYRPSKNEKPVPIDIWIEVLYLRNSCSPFAIVTRSTRARANSQRLGDPSSPSCPSRTSPFHQLRGLFQALKLGGGGVDQDAGKLQAE
jgi:hypothetical protein